MYRVSHQHPNIQPVAHLDPLHGMECQKKRGCVEKLAIIFSYIFFILTFPLSVWFCYRVVTQYERAVVFRLGHLRPGGARGPGLFFVLPCIDTYYKVDLRTLYTDIPPQDVLTRDSVSVKVDAVLFYRVEDPLRAIISVAHYDRSTRLLAATILRNILGMHSLFDILSERKTIAQSMEIVLDEATDPWGIKVEKVEITDVTLPAQMQRAMATEAETSREARAKVIAAEGELKASRALKEASDVLIESPGALQLRYLQTLSAISTEKHATIIFPLPMDFVSPFMGER